MAHDGSGKIGFTFPIQLAGSVEFRNRVPPDRIADRGEISVHTVEQTSLAWPTAKNNRFPLRVLST